IMLALQNTPDPKLELPGVQSNLKLYSVGASKFDLTMEFREVHAENGSPDGISGFLEYSTDLFKRETAEMLIYRLLRLLDGALSEPDQHIGLLDILAPEERQKILVDWNGNSDEKEQASIPSLLEEQVKKYPHHIALVYGETSLTYEEVNKRANQLARLLIAKGIGPEQFVALALPRSLEMVIGLLAVLKAGAAYLPLDPEYPADRLSFMLSDAQPACVLTDSSVASKLPEMADIRQIILDEASTIEELEHHSPINPTDVDRIRPLSPLNSAYIIYTSGSTGVPKGVVVPHQNVIRLFGST
ncbi:AMP-binding protein, partial [Bacillus sp. mrc49]